VIKNKDFQILLILSVFLFLDLQFFYEISNFRILNVQSNASSFAALFFDGESLSNWKPSGGDDIGLPLLMGISYIVSGEISKDIPLLFIIINKLIFVFSMFLLFRTLKYFVKSEGYRFVVTLIMACYPFTLLLAFNNDIYLFPFYVYVMCLYIFSHLHIERKISYVKLSIVITFIHFLVLFRTSSWILIPFCAVLYSVFNLGKIKHHWKRMVGFCLISLSLLVFKNGAKSFSSGEEHVVWHSMHAGLMEFGGYITAEREIIPGFLEHNYNIQDNWFYANHWADSFQYQFVKSKIGVGCCSEKYEDFLKKDLLKLITKYPNDFFLLACKRFVNAFDLYLYNDFSGTSYYKTTVISRILSILIFLFCMGFILKRKRDKTNILLFIGAPLIAPTILVHSTHIIYNIPFRLVLFLFILIGISQLDFIRNYIMRPILNFRKYLGEIFTDNSHKD
jgi:hypothetical protein